MPDRLSRAQGSLAGLAIGDALGRPAEGMSPEEIQNKWGRIEGYVTETPVGSDDTEYAMLTALALLKFPNDFTAANIGQFWRDEISGQEGPFNGGGFSEMSAVRNLAKGIMPPQSGQHSHAWSDGLAMRIAPVGIVCAGDPAKAAEYALQDGLVSHSEEGIYSGQAIAVAVAVAMDGGTAETATEAALASIPEHSWTAHLIRESQRVVAEFNTWEEIAPHAVERIACLDYYWADLAPEAVGLTFAAVLGGDGDFRTSVLNAVNLGRDADTIAAMAGGIAGAISGIEAVPQEWVPSISSLQGVCLRVTKDMHPLEIAKQLVELTEKENAHV